MFLPSQSVGRRFSPSADGDNREREERVYFFRYDGRGSGTEGNFEDEPSERRDFLLLFTLQCFSLCCFLVCQTRNFTGQEGFFPLRAIPASL